MTRWWLASVLCGAMSLVGGAAFAQQGLWYIGPMPPECERIGTILVEDCDATGCYEDKNPDYVACLDRHGVSAADQTWRGEPQRTNRETYRAVIVPSARFLFRCHSNWDAGSCRRAELAKASLNGYALCGARIEVESANSGGWWRFDGFTPDRQALWIEYGSQGGSWSNQTSGWMYLAVTLFLHRDDMPVSASDQAGVCRWSFDETRRRR